MKFNKNDVRIIVAGHAAAGKSTIIQIIAEALNSKGVDFKILADEIDNPLVDTDFQEKREMAVSKKTNVIIEERQIYKSLTGPGSEIVGLRETKR